MHILKRYVSSAVLCILPLTQLSAAQAACSQTDAPIEVDRPDVTNSSVVVPAGSLQVENGLNWSNRRTATLLDGPNTRVRFGVADCNEILIDLPSDIDRLTGTASSGLTDVSPAVKHQFAPLPGDVQLSATFGVGLPTGARAVAGRGYQPYVQFPWSRELQGGWGLSGMLTTFWSPGEDQQHVRLEPTFVIERALGFNADFFVEYVGEYPTRGTPAQSVNTGAAYRLTRLQQIDFHLSFGLNQPAPRYVFGVGYSVRCDGLL